MSGADIRSLLPDELRAALGVMGQPGYRAGQILRWLQRGVMSFDEMTDLPADLRRRLGESFTLSSVTVVRKLVSALDGTVKYLFAFADGAAVESVVMHYRHGYSICVSTQVGCRMGCVFCATGQGGLQRDLTAGEILCQIVAAQRDLGVRISHTVLMGMGEPLDNYDNVLRFLRLVSHPDGLGISGRHVSLSTCGLVDRIRQLAGEELTLTLSVSLHAPNDTVRGRLMPISRRWSIDQLLDACRYYVDRTGRRISFEYTVVAGVNDSDACAAELAGRLRGMLCHVNLMPANPVQGSGCKGGGRETVERFQKQLISRGVNATVRRTLGADIQASCGQLRQRSTIIDKGGIRLENSQQDR